VGLLKTIDWLFPVLALGFWVLIPFVGGRVFDFFWFGLRFGYWKWRK
jgi:hypothetical protein